MASKIKAHLPRLVLTLLLSAGLLLTLLFALDLQASLPLCLLICLVLSVGLEAISLSRRSALWHTTRMGPTGKSGGCATIRE